MAFDVQDPSRDDYISMSLHDMFRVIGDQLTQRDLKVLKFFSSAFISDEMLSNVHNGYDFFLCMEAMNRVTETNFRHFMDLLRIISRHDMSQFVNLRRRHPVLPDPVSEYLDGVSITNNGSSWTDAPLAHSSSEPGPSKSASSAVCTSVDKNSTVGKKRTFATVETESSVSNSEQCEMVDSSPQRVKRQKLEQGDDSSSKSVDYDFDTGKAQNVTSANEKNSISNNENVKLNRDGPNHDEEAVDTRTNNGGNSSCCCHGDRKHSVINSNIKSKNRAGSSKGKCVSCTNVNCSVDNSRIQSTSSESDRNFESDLKCDKLETVSTPDDTVTLTTDGSIDSSGNYSRKIKNESRVAGTVSSNHSGSETVIDKDEIPSTSRHCTNTNRIEMNDTNTDSCVTDTSDSENGYEAVKMRGAEASHASMDRSNVCDSGTNCDIESPAGTSRQSSCCEEVQSGSSAHIHIEDTESGAPRKKFMCDIRLRVRAEYCQHSSALEGNVFSNKPTILERQFEKFTQANTILKSRDLGSIVCDIKFSELTYLDAFWRDYINGSLLEALKGVFLTDSLKQAVGHEAIKLLVNVDEDDYEAGRLQLLKNQKDCQQIL